MKRTLIFVAVLGLIISVASARHYSPMVGGGIGFSFLHVSYSHGSDSDVGVNLSFEGMVPVYNSLYARATLLGLRVGETSFIELGTGSSFDLVYFIPSRNIEPYGTGGVRIESHSNGYSYTTFSIAFGGGAQMKLKTAPVRPFAEFGVAIAVTGGDYEQTSIGFGMSFGVRYGK